MTNNNFVLLATFYASRLKADEIAIVYKERNIQK